MGCNTSKHDAIDVLDVQVEVKPAEGAADDVGLYPAEPMTEACDETEGIARRSASLTARRSVSFQVAEGRASGRVGRPATHWQRHRRTCKETGTTTYKNHPSHLLQQDIKRGLRASVHAARPLYDPSRPLTREECELQHRILDPKERVKFKAAAPRAFAHVRSIFGVDDDEYLGSICGNDDLVELSTPGKSGAVFFKSADGRFILKTVSKVESKFLRSMLYDYTMHVKGMAATLKLKTLLPHFYDLIHIDADGRNIRLVVMNNLKPKGVAVHESYDLKGSTVGRWASEREKSRESCTLKDLDFQHTLHVLPKDLELVREQLSADTAFLQRLGVVDYSLLAMLSFTRRAQPNLRHAAELRSFGTEAGGVPDGAASDQADARSELTDERTDDLTSLGGISYRSDSESDGGEVDELEGAPSEDTVTTQASSQLSAATTVLSSKSRQGASPIGSFRGPVAGGASLPGALLTHVLEARDGTSGGEADGEATGPLRGMNGVLHATTADGDELVLHCGIIDVLQQWRLRKMTEHSLKSLYYMGEQFSVIPPVPYQERFFTQMMGKFQPAASPGDAADGCAEGDGIVENAEGGGGATDGADAAKEVGTAPPTPEPPRFATV